MCSINENYEIRYSDDGSMYNFMSTFQYVVGRNDTVTFEIKSQTAFSKVCEVTVNGQLCNSCSNELCEDGFGSVRVDCENVDGAGSVALCDEKSIDDDGPLAVFALQDPAYLEGCPPRMYEHSW